MVTWYEVSRFSIGPRALEFERETAKFLIHKNGRREAKVSRYSRWYATEEEAEAVISARIAAEEEKKDAMLILNASRDMLEALEGYDQAVRVAIQMLNRSGHPSAQEIGDELRAKLGHACDVIARARGEA